MSRNSPSLRKFSGLGGAAGLTCSFTRRVLPRLIRRAVDREGLADPEPAAVHQPHGGGPIWRQPGRDALYPRVSEKDEVSRSDDAGQLDTGAGRLGDALVSRTASASTALTTKCEQPIRLADRPLRCIPAIGVLMSSRRMAPIGLSGPPTGARIRPAGLRGRGSV